MSLTIHELFLENSIKLFLEMKKQAEKAITQIKDDKALFYLPDGESNSIAILVKHISGNIRSRWTDIFTTDGEKDNRNRPSEFDQEFRPTRPELMEVWNSGWDILFATLNNLKPEDLEKTIFIRKEPHLVLESMQRQLTHYSVHVGQITFLAKLIEWKDWQTLSIQRDEKVFDFKELSK